MPLVPAMRCARGVLLRCDIGWPPPPKASPDTDHRATVLSKPSATFGYRLVAHLSMWDGRRTRQGENEDPTCKRLGTRGFSSGRHRTFIAGSRHRHTIAPMTRRLRVVRAVPLIACLLAAGWATGATAAPSRSQGDDGASGGTPAYRIDSSLAAAPKCPKGKVSSVVRGKRVCVAPVRFPTVWSGFYRLDQKDEEEPDSFITRLTAVGSVKLTLKRFNVSPANAWSLEYEGTTRIGWTAKVSYRDGVTNRICTGERNSGASPITVGVELKMVFPLRKARLPSPSTLGRYWFGNAGPRDRQDERFQIVELNCPEPMRDMDTSVDPGFVLGPQAVGGLPLSWKQRRLCCGEGTKRLWSDWNLSGSKLRVLP
jgi:hypothetical protein